MSYITVVGGTSSELIQHWGCTNNACSTYLISFIIVIFIVLPLCLYRFYGHLAIISVVSILSIGSVLLLVIIGGPLNAVEGPINLISTKGI